MGYFEHQGMRFYYRTTGKGIPFIMLHGMGGDTRQVRRLFQPPEGVQMIYMDQRGNGYTEIGPLKKLRFDVMAEDVEALADYLKLGRFILGGVSMGAAVAVRYAVEHHDRVIGLVLIRPAWTHFPMEVEVRELYHRIAELVETSDSLEEAAGIYVEWEKYRSLKKKAPEAAKSLLKHFSEYKIEDNSEKFRVLPEQSPFHNPGQLKQIGCKTLVLATAKDPIHRLQYGQYYRDYIPDAEFVEIIPKSEGIRKHYESVQVETERFLSKTGAPGI
ncbi:alpha/beta fold hydrolase [Dorea sp. D27]|uniref:alpha/beta fold hydrolase n=1 Tax=Dorea sp. D27 TaxID=658665 RepID=UPI000673ABFC|nr:alpha/beta hydrolase [Dorea sp. D27]KMZ54444.1 putative hydrolase, alpha/beta fold family [Dorea sp. D27]